MYLKCLYTSIGTVIHFVFELSQNKQNLFILKTFIHENSHFFHYWVQLYSIATASVMIIYFYKLDDGYIRYFYNCRFVRLSIT